MVELLGGSLAAALLMGLAALLVGFAKTSLGGLAVISVSLFATLLPAKESTAAILVLLIVGDLVAVWHYRHDADWSLIRRLLPAVLPGLVLGSVFLYLVTDDILRRSIGILLLVLIIIQLVIKWRGEVDPSNSHERPWAAWIAGTGAGFATMTANAAGAVMTLYLSASGIEKRRFIGTNAWFFLIVNLAKVPFSFGLGLMHWSDVGRGALLAPVILLGGILGYAVARRISQRRFDVAVLLASGIAAGALVL